MHSSRIDGYWYQQLDQQLQSFIVENKADLSAQFASQSSLPESLLNAVQCSGEHQQWQTALQLSDDSAEWLQRLHILQRCWPDIEAYKATQGITASLMAQTFLISIPMAQFMAQQATKVRREQQRAVVFGLSGGQGSGKTTSNHIVQIILQQGLGLNTVGFSIDDVYHTYAQRQQMGDSIHPLFAIRSVAGTHDTALAIATLQALRDGVAGESVAIPQFDKSMHNGEGDRRAKHQWPVVEAPVDVVVFEGWCIGATAQTPDEIQSPINQLESEEDADGVWRNSMNQYLANEYQTLFSLIDHLFFLRVDGMAAIQRNRESQEAQLRQRLSQHKVASDIKSAQHGLGAMTPAQVRRFVSLFERTSMDMMKTLPQQAKLTLHIGDGHAINSISVND